MRERERERERHTHSPPPQKDVGGIMVFVVESGQNNQSSNPG